MDKATPQLTIDEGFRRLIHELSADEVEDLEYSLGQEGCRDALVVWLAQGNGHSATGERVLLDGHHRYDICTRLGIEYRVCELALPDREAAELWIIRNQLGRRNLHPIHKVPLVERKREILEAQARARQAHGLTAPGRTLVPNLAQATKRKVRDALATEAGVSHSTYDKLLAINEMGIPELVDAVAESRASASAAAIIAAMPEDEQRAAVAEALEKDDFAGIAKAHVAHNSGDNEWYTPPEYIAAAKAVMGVIDLDPASTAEANGTVGADRFFSVEDDGLAQGWAGRVWMNPPYASGLVERFAEKLGKHYTAGDVPQAIVLVNNATETKWFQSLLQHASAMALPAGRVRFWHPRKESAPLQGQAVLYLGPQREAFAREFAALGMVLYVV